MCACLLDSQLADSGTDRSLSTVLASVGVLQIDSGSIRRRSGGSADSIVRAIAHRCQLQAFWHCFLLRRQEIPCDSPAVSCFKQDQERVKGPDPPSRRNPCFQQASAWAIGRLLL
ncbi:unnamed protein product [Effrenium voratum]|uniref:Uncharacterized protein n=1 Tax=Effrenium voratum TaxID=2562239 RepID=A0AA36N1U1_9DINO|nr:unnamed protein product [Effrenium voratum]CAJ1440615.1 unnamed protein product [Effrenium voratum]